MKEVEKRNKKEHEFRVDIMLQDEMLSKEARERYNDDRFDEEEPEGYWFVEDMYIDSFDVIDKKIQIFFCKKGEQDELSPLFVAVEFDIYILLRLLSKINYDTDNLIKTLVEQKSVDMKHEDLMRAFQTLTSAINGLKLKEAEE
ncbi:MAG: hypothetical protein GF411_03080 [Candidatus Lokiarchaeota archaeon]|nr:hypothetical protein [Candidatus Lokiarchaeota archaeon]